MDVTAVTKEKKSAFQAELNLLYFQTILLSSFKTPSKHDINN